MDLRDRFFSGVSKTLGFQTPCEEVFQKTYPKDRTGRRSYDWKTRERHPDVVGDNVEFAAVPDPLFYRLEAM